MFRNTVYNYHEGVEIVHYFMEFLTLFIYVRIIFQKILIKIS